MAKSSLVIVESPAKAKTIGKYLGPGYQVKACMGHLRDLPKSTLGVDIENNFEPKYCPIKGKEDIISDLKKSAKASDTVFLATDPDREGEAISWHLKELLGLADEKARRVTFNEITKRVVSESIARPREIDQSLVDAQQARRILDRIVGYQLSPLLWKKIRRGLSAGRVQSVATRLVCEREEEIRNFQSEEYWSLDADLERIRPNLGRFTAAFYGADKRQELHSEAEVNAVMEAVKTAPFTVAGVKRQEKQRSPAAPFTTVAKWWDQQAQETGLPVYMVHGANRACTTENPGWSAHDQLTRQVISLEECSNLQGSIFNSLASLSANPKNSTTLLQDYYSNNVKAEHILKELTFTRPTQLQISTTDKTYTFQGASDPNSPVTMDGKTVETDENGFFSVTVSLSPGENKYTFNHKEKTKMKASDAWAPRKNFSV